MDFSQEASDWWVKTRDEFTAGLMQSGGPSTSNIVPKPVASLPFMKQPYFPVILIGGVLLVAFLLFRKRG